MARVLVVHGDPETRAAVADRLAGTGHATVVVDRPADAAAVLGSGRIDLVLARDCAAVPVADGLPVVVALRHPADPHAADAYDVLPCPPTDAGFAGVVGRAAAYADLLRRHRTLCLTTAVAAGPLPAGSSPAIRAVRKHVAALAESAAAVLVRGEFGTGKRTLARALHRGNGPVVTVDGASGPDVAAAVAAAAAGTLVVTDVGRLPAAAQRQLLRAVRRGSCRVVATTTADLSDSVDDGTFAGELLDALAGEVVTLPPLRDRPEDVPELARQLLLDASRRAGRPARELDAAAASALQRYHWPGNAWELANVLGRAEVVQPDGPAILAQTITPWLTAAPAADPVRTTVDALAGRPLADTERRVILTTLQQFKGHRVKTAGALGIGVRTLGIKLKRWRDEGQLGDEVRENGPPPNVR